VGGDYVAPFWPPLEYLLRIFDRSPNDVLNIIEEFPDTKNFRVLDGIIQIIIKANTVDSILKFYRFINFFIENPNWGHENIVALLNKEFFFDSKLSEITPVLLLKIISFMPDPQENEKRSLRKENLEAWGSSLSPSPRFNQWEYQQILEKGVRPLAEQKPFQIAKILVDATASMIRMGIHTDELDKRMDEDFSDIWCRRLNEKENIHHDVKENLLHTLVYACEQVYAKAPESVAALDQVLRNQRWKIFKRLRQYLYALFPNEQTMPWIQEIILEHSDYSRWEHHYEFQLMIRNACEHFGQQLLSESELKKILEAILEGPSKEDHREWMGENYSDDGFQQRQAYFHRMQLRPFSKLLYGEYLSYYERIESSEQTKDISDESYAPHKVTSGSVTLQSPKSLEELDAINDNELLDYLNEWNDGHRDPDDWLIEITISALSKEFQHLFKNRIILDQDRLAFWMKNRDKIERPIYITVMINAMQELVKEKSFDALDQWIEFSDWVLSHQDSEDIDEQPKPRDDSRDHPNWRSARRAVVDFIDVCVNKDTNTPFSDDS